MIRRAASGAAGSSAAATASARVEPWTGVVRCEAATDLSLPQLTALANLSQAVLCRYASVAYKDSRAPQNLVPIAGLENTLRHRLGDTRVLYRALREAAQ